MSSSQPKQLPEGTTEHRLSETSRKQWWQLAHLWAIRLKPNNYTNQCLMAQLVFLLQLPVMMVIWSFSVRSYDPALIKMLLLTAAVWVAGLTMFGWTFRHHQRKVMVARASEEFLELESPFYNRKVRWLDISTVYPVQNTDLGQNEHVLVCRNGELFFLGNDLSDCAGLIDKIRKHLPAENDIYETNFCIPYGHFDMPMIAVFAIVVAVSFGPLKLLLFATHLKLQEALAAFLPVFIVGAIAFAFVWYCFTRIPQIIRLGKNSVYLKTRTSAHTLASDQILVGKFGRLITLKSRAGNFLIYATTKDVVGQKLIEQKKNI